MKRHLMPAAALVTVLVLVLFVPATGFSQLSEGFEDGIPSGWTFNGPVGLDGTAQASSGITPAGGNSYGWISNGCTSAAGTTCPTFATLPTPSFSSLGLTPGPDMGTPSYETVLTSPSFTLAQPGGLISFDVNFITTDGSYQFADFALVQLVPSSCDGCSPINLFVANTTTATGAAVPPGELSPGVATISPATAVFAGTTVTFGATTYGNVSKYGTDPSCEPAAAGPIASCPGGPTGWMHVTYSAPAGTYTLQFMVSHLTDQGYPSALAIDNVQTSTEQQLTLTELGLGSGTVTDNTGQIDCSEASGVVTGTCSASYATGTLVILTASANETSTFGGWGGACASFGTSTTCSLTMNSSQNASASFNAPGPTQAGTVMTGKETVFNFQGGVAAGGYDYNAELTSGPPVMAQVTAISVVDQLTCNVIVNPTFPGAQCFVYDKGSGPNTPSPVMFELTCPGSPTGGTCGSIDQPTFLATLGTDLNFALLNNPMFNKNEPLVGWLKGVGPDPLHPCKQNPGNYPPLFQSNQIGSFSLTGDPTGIVKGSSGGTGSCWLSTYKTPLEAPSVTIVAPANGGTYQQNQVTHANYTCTAVNNSNINGGVAGPYLTVPPASCSATDTPGGSVANGAQFDTATLGSHTFTATVVDSATNTVSQTVTYNVVGAADVAILKLAPRKVRSGTKLTYLIGVGDFGAANAVNVTVNDPLPPGTAFLSASGTNLACSIVNGKFTCSTTPVPCAFAGGIVSCNAGTIMPFSLWFLNGAVIQITVQVTAPAGTLNNTATVSASNADPKPGNNSSTASTTVTTH